MLSDDWSRCLGRLLACLVRTSVAKCGHSFGGGDGDIEFEIGLNRGLELAGRGKSYWFCYSLLTLEVVL